MCIRDRMGTDEKFYVVNIDDNVTPVELSTLILKELKNFVQGEEIPEACVITIPASFDSMQSNATLKAGKDAGFKDVFLLQEPIAASLAFFNNSAGAVSYTHLDVYKRQLPHIFIHRFITYFIDYCFSYNFFHDFCSPCHNRSHTGIAIGALDREIRHVTVTAKNL